MSIVLRVENSTTHIEGRLASVDYQALKKYLGYLPEDAIWSIKHVQLNSKEQWKKDWDGRISTICWNYDKCKCSIKKSGTHFPTGLALKALAFLRERGVDIIMKDDREEVHRSLDFHMSSEFESRNYQKEVIDIACSKERGIIQAATGSGKTSIAASIIAYRGLTPTIFYVPSIDLLTQAKTEIERFVKCGKQDIKVGELSGLKKDIQDITVMTIQTAVRALGGVWIKYDDEDRKKEKDDITAIKEAVKELIRTAELIICDEVQHWAAETCQIISDNSLMARFRFGLSATPFRDKGDDILIEACFGKTLANITASDLIKIKYLVQPSIMFIPIDYKPTKKASYPNIYKEGIVNNIYRNNMIATLAKNMINEGRCILILCKQIAHGKILEKLIEGSAFLHGSCSAKKRKEHLDKMRSGEANVTIASTIFDEGIDCKPLDGLILAGSGKSSTRALQRIGRVLRPYTYPNGKVKNGALVIDFMDNCKYLQNHSKARLKIYKTEPQFKIELL